MAENTRLVHATPEQVWEVLSDGWLYPVWVVGASRMREVDDDWPAVGSKLHHSVGLWPLLIDDNTEVTATVPGHSVTLRARAWPVGEAEVSIRLLPVGAETEVRIIEDAVSGPGVLAPRPVRGVTLKWRNTETLRRLALIAEGRR
ncbi:polyketide cyclase [Nocardioides sp. Soil777]|uniref:SRPBCC family protein n=1 Tax=Nocardioides sp. Soil777 TaxID=1736409 RepID=UPI0007033B13|nr:SRPBCC family protein [Nocardioides sp. Soil777]KRE99691.1 polyketide cyclase [Nocardioides sp. Soil777]